MSNSEMWCAISDIHGDFERLKQLEEKVLADHPDIRFIYLGDFVDRGPNSKEALSHVMEQAKKGHVAVKGNHDLFFQAYLEGEYDEFPFTFGIDTIRSYYPQEPCVCYDDSKRLRRMLLAEYPDILSFLQELILVHEEGKTVFIHGGFNPHRSHYLDSSETELTMPAWKMPAHSGLFPDRDFVFGHVPTMNYRSDALFSPYTKENFTFIDGGSVFGGQLNALISDGTHYSV